MPKSARFYIYGVIATGLALFAMSLRDWPPAQLSGWLVYVVLAMAASWAKLRLPGLTRTYSLSFLLLLFGVLRFSLPEVLIAGCAGALVQSVCNTKKRPTRLQTLFNMSNLIVSVTASFVVARVLLSSEMAHYRPAVMAAVAFVYFVVNTVLVSGVLALLEGKRLGTVCQDWYVWSFPYYLVGAVLVGLVPAPGQTVSGEGWLLLLPLPYLIHFFIGLMKARPAAVAVNRGEFLPTGARGYVFGVIGAGALLLAFAGFTWQSQDLPRFIGYLLLTVLSSTFKVRLPGMRGAVTPAFVMHLVAIAQLGFSEAVIMATIAGVVQCVWKPKKTPTATRTWFNGACIGLSSAAAFLVCRVMLSPWMADSMLALLLTATLVLYTCNTVMVAVALCLVEHKPLLSIWQVCYFWSCPYYLVGSAAAGLMIATSRVAGWQPSLLVLPMMGLVYLSYRTHVSEHQSASDN